MLAVSAIGGLWLRPPPKPRLRQLALSALFALAALSLKPAAAAQLGCKVHEDVCIGGDNLQVFLSVASPLLGCVESPSPQSCCELCAFYWPDCLSYTYIYEGNAANGLAGKNNYCCLRTSFMQDAVEDTNCDSGYQNPRCYLTSDCTAYLDSNTGFSSSDSILLLEDADQDCGASATGAGEWAGITNPVDVRNDGSYRNYDLGRAATGLAGEFRMCHSSSPVVPGFNPGQYAVPLGGLTFRGPYQGQYGACTLAVECRVTLDGIEFPADPANYFIAIIHWPNDVVDHSIDPCGAGARIAEFDSMENPRRNEDDAFDNMYNFATPRSGQTLIPYAMCWKNNPQNQNDMAEYTLYIGIFEMSGPAYNEFNCTMALQCNLTIVGRALLSTNALLVQTLSCGDLIGFAELGEDFENPTQVEDDGSYGEYRFGLPVHADITKGPGTHYKICWAPVMIDPATPTDPPPFVIDIGPFTINGPAVKDFECAFTVDCTIEVTGSGLDLWVSKMYIIAEDEECGDPNVQEAYIDGFLWFNPMSLSSTTRIDYLGREIWEVKFGTAETGVGSSRYTACWAPHPEEVGDYKMPVGNFVFKGPYMSTGTFCIKGEFCRITISGVGLFRPNYLLLLEEDLCGNINGTLTEFSPMANVKKVNDDGVYAEYEMGIAQWGFARPGYHMCWAYDPNPDIKEEFTFHVGDFRMKGASYRDMECTMGWPCELELLGIDFQNTNRLIVIEEGGECGMVQPDLASFTGMSYSGQVTDVAPYESYSLGTATQGMPSAHYIVCWAHDPGPVISPDYYRVYAGELAMVGPVQVDQTCTMTVFCTLYLTGTRLSTNEKLLIIDGTTSCGDVSPQVMYFEGMTNPTPTNVSEPGRFDMGVAATGPPSKDREYKICWAYAPTQDVDYKVELGEFILIGPIGSTVELLYDCTQGLECIVEVTGEGLEMSNFIMVTHLDDNCGSPLNIPDFGNVINPAPILSIRNGDTGVIGTFSFGTVISGKVGNFTICWSFMGGGQRNYDVRVGTLRFAGPDPQELGCTLSEDCQLYVSGVRQSHTSRILILYEEDTCGDLAADVPSWPGINNPARSHLVGPPGGGGAYTYENGDIYDVNMGTAGEVGRFYQLCWAFDPPGGPSTLAAYIVQVGPFSISGPNNLEADTTVFKCTLGVACHVVIYGYGLFDPNQVLIVAGDGDCGSDDVVPATMEGIVNPKPVMNDNEDNKYFMGMQKVGGSYTHCRVDVPAPSCIGDHYKLCWGHGDSDPPNFVVFIGHFEMSGPYGTWAAQCTLGQVCAFKLYGMNLRSTNKMLLVDPGSNCGDDKPVFAEIAGFTNPQSTELVSSTLRNEIFRFGVAQAGKETTYKICWAHSPKVLHDYSVYVGPFHFVAPPPGCTYTDPLTLACDDDEL